MNVVKKLSNAAVLASALIGSASELCAFLGAQPPICYLVVFAGKNAEKWRRLQAVHSSCGAIYG